MADGKSYISFHDGQTYTKPEKKSKRIETTDFLGIHDQENENNEEPGLYERLQEEILQRGGYQSIKLFTPKENGNLGNISKNSIKADVKYFNDVMQTRPYIASGGNDEYGKNQEEWYQKSDKDKIETLIYDLKQGKTVVNTGCSNTCTGTCSVTCGGTMAA